MNEKIGVWILIILLSAFVLSIVWPALSYDSEGKKTIPFRESVQPKTGGFEALELDPASSELNENKTVSDIPASNIGGLTS